MDILYILGITYLVIFSIYHIIQGIISFFFSNFAIYFNKKVYGFTPMDNNIQLKMILKPWGSFAISIGVVGILILMDIQSYSIFLIPLVFLLGFRSLYRSIYFKVLKKHFKVSYFQNIRMIIIQIMGILLFLYIHLSLL